MTSIAGPRVEPLDRERAREQAIVDQFLAFFSVVLGGYAIGSKGFAYLGVAPLYIGELSLLFGLVALWHTRAKLALLQYPTIRLLGVFMLFGAARTLPYVRQYGLDALRDGVLWGYGTFSIIVAGVILSRPERLSQLVARYRRFVPMFLIAAPLAWIGTILVAQLSRLAGSSVPTWPGSDVPLLSVKAGDLLVHLGGVGAFMCVGLAGRARPWRSVLLVAGVAVTSMSRGGLLAFSLCYGVAMASRPRGRSGWQTTSLVFAASALLAITGLRLRFPGNDREISFQQLVQQVETTAGGESVGSSAGQDQQNTKAWRLAWWAEIVNYTILGDYRWTGKGYGVNLADDDGFQVTDDDSLRSPHNVHMTVLARSGLIGLGLWLLLQGAWLLGIVRGIRDARRQGAREWYALFTFLLAYWLALLVNGTFDVYIEGPAGGIWFWTIFGLGIAADIIYRNREQLALPAAPERAAARGALPSSRSR
ncbi:MAG TPA: O-antigen ligase family protein [Acidobacteriaceae bacterium]|nr:O-antigen ligase family protein [Acidobacteriaceae bacterium]